MRCKVTLASGLYGTLTLKDSARAAAPVEAPRTRRAVDQPERVAEVVRALLGDRIGRVEVVVALSVDSRGRMIAAHEVSIGSLNSSVIHPREVFRPAIMDGAAAVILAHNHPSGDPTPSVEDHQVTTRLQEAGVILGVRLLDHVVVAVDDLRSFAQQGWMRT